MRTIRRRHLFEFEDQQWLPTFVRDTVTNFLRESLVVGGRVYEPVAPLLASLLRSSGAGRVVDLCSGGGGPWTHLTSDLTVSGWRPRLLLTDKYPNLLALDAVCREIGPGADYCPDPVDATSVPEYLTGVRTLFTSFHHLRPSEARAVLADASRRGIPIGIFEFTERSLPAILKTLVIAPTMTLASVKGLPGSWWRLPFTYVFPLIPLVVTWDAVVSNLRTYTCAELHALVSDIQSENYTWEIGRIPGSGRQPPITYIQGRPEPRNASTASTPEGVTS